MSETRRYSGRRGITDNFAARVDPFDAGVVRKLRRVILHRRQQLEL